MRILRQLAFVAATLYSLNVPTQSRVLPHGSLASKDYECLAAGCLDLVPLSVDHSVKHDGNAILNKRTSLFQRGPPVGRPGRPKPDPDSPTVKPGQTPSRPGGSEDTPAHIGADTTPLNFGASKPGDPGFTPIGDSKDPAYLRTKGQKVDEQAYKTSDEYDGAALQKKFDDNYRSSTVEEQGELSDFLDGDLAPPLKDLGINDMESLRYRETEVFSNANSGAPTAQTKYFPEDGIIVGEMRSSHNDLNPEEQRLRPSDLIFNQWKSSFGENDGRVNALRAFVGRYIQSKSTVEAMQKAQRDTRVALYDKATFKRAADTPEEKEAFYLMEGTDFISSLVYMLKDNAPVRFHIEFTSLKITG
ncbi:MAG: hypothetical protein Q9213_005967 [Squamulea squamosa]